MIADILARFRIPAYSVWRNRSLLSIPDGSRGDAAGQGKYLLLVIASIACGWIGWSGEVLVLPVAMIFPALWAMAPSRLTAALVSAGYFLAASRGLPQGVANFYAADLWPGLLLWVAASMSFVGVHALLWMKAPDENASGKRGSADAARVVRYGLAMVLTGLPPFGITGWAHPMTAGGALFPGWGWWGVSAAAAALLVMTTRLWRAAAIVLATFWLWSAAHWTAPNVPDGWMGVDLHQGQNLGRDGSLAYQRDLIGTVLRTATQHPATRVVVLPESTLGFGTPTVAHVWRESLRGSNLTVITGAAVVDPGGYDNVMVAISAGEAKILYRERMPVPGSMWQPWLRWTGQGGGARADFFGNPVVKVAGARIAPLICYEQLILWPFLQSILHRSEIIVATGNGWWTDGTSIVAIQKASVTAWAKLFDLPVVTAFNT
jgi:hypothetical protein